MENNKNQNQTEFKNPVVENATEVVVTEKTGLSTGKKVGIGVAIAAAVTTVCCFLYKRFKK